MSIPDELRITCATCEEPPAPCPLGHLGKPERQDVHGMMNALYYDRGQIIWQEGVFRPGCFIICAGTADLLVRSISGKRRVIRSLQPGEMVPCLNGLHAAPANSDFAVQVESKSQLLLHYLASESFGYLMVRYPSIATKVIDRLSAAVIELIHDLGVSSYCTVRARVARALECLDQGERFTLPMSQQAIAELVGASREAVNKVLHDMSQEQIITVNHHRIQIISKEKLHDLQM